MQLPNTLDMNQTEQARLNRLIEKLNVTGELKDAVKLCVAEDPSFPSYSCIQQWLQRRGVKNETISVLVAPGGTVLMDIKPETIVKYRRNKRQCTTQN